MYQIDWRPSRYASGVFTKAEATRKLQRMQRMQNSMSSNSYRMVEVEPKTGRKPETRYRRHAAVTLLELRGARHMLSNALSHLAAKPANADRNDAMSILIHARIEITAAFSKVSK